MISIVAIILAAIANILVGMVWYSNVMFGPEWRKLNNMSKKDLEGTNMKQQSFSWFLVALIIALVLSFFINVTGASDVLSGAYIGFLAAVGFVATTAASSVIWGKTNPRLYFMDALNSVVSFIIMGGIIGIWA